MSMLINHSFDSHFVSLLEKLQKKYGEEMFKLEGISRENLDINRFTNKFLETKTTADISVDANANVDDISMLSWNYEFPKALMKLNSLYHLWTSALKKHGIKRANKMVELEIAGGIRIHDLHGWLMPYSYYGSTKIYIKDSGSQIRIADLFKKYQTEKTSLPDREVIDLSNKNIYVRDKNNTYTKVTQCLKHKRDTKLFAFYFEIDSNIKENCLIVTANHPMIMSDGTEKNAELVKVSEKLMGNDQHGHEGYVITKIVEINSFNDITNKQTESADEIDKDVEYVYDISTESHTFNVGVLLCHNCWAASLAPIVLEGMPWIKNIRVKPVKHFDTLISNSIKYIYNLSTQCVGAIAVPDLFAYAQYFIRKDYGEEWYNDKTSVRHVKQGFQQWIYGINDKARGNQSPFTNVSIFDSYWRKAMFEHHTNPDFSTCDLENLKRTQRLFIDVMIEQQKDNPFTFPVVTACQLKDPETGEIMDKDWLDWLASKLVQNKLFNIYSSSSIDSLSSCLFKGNKITVIHKKTGIKETLDISDFVHRFINIENIDKEVNISEYQIKGYNVITGKSEIVDISGVIKKSNRSGLKITISTGDEEISVSPDHIIAIRNIDDKEVKELTAAELIKIENTNFEISVNQNGLIWKKIDSVKNEFVSGNENVVYCLELDKLYYFSANNIISHNCCRLRNNINPLLKKDLKDKEYTNSFGVGGLSIGAHRVVALNLPQIAFMAKCSEGDNWTDFFKILESRVKIAQDILDIHRETLKFLIKNGNLPMYQYGCMDLSKQYSTVGFIGLFEALEILGLDIRNQDGTAKGKEIISLINRLNDERTAIDGNIRNVQQIPGESAAVTFAAKDKLQFANVDYELYSNQYIPLVKEALMADRIRIQGQFDADVSGGSILHLDVDQQLTKQQIISIIQAAAKMNVIYFAIDDCLAQCKSCGKVYVGKYEKSPCHNSKMTYYMRVVGFRTPVESWNKTRRIKDHPHRYMYNDSPFM